jgi:hypothetical protein
MTSRMTVDFRTLRWRLRSKLRAGLELEDDDLQTQGALERPHIGRRLVNQANTLLK